MDLLPTFSGQKSKPGMEENGTDTERKLRRRWKRKPSKKPAEVGGKFSNTEVMCTSIPN
jgi:hypothetical protein